LHRTLCEGTGRVRKFFANSFISVMTSPQTVTKAVNPENNMEGEYVRRMCFCYGIWGLLCAWSVASQAVAAQPLASTMRSDLQGVHDVEGFRIISAPDLSDKAISGDEAPAQAYEIIRPDAQPFDIGRLYTSCTCVQLSTLKSHYAKGERAVFYLRNILPTPPDGQQYSFFIQIKAPVKATLRYETFVRSTRFIDAADLPNDTGADLRIPATFDEPGVIDTTTTQSLDGSE
jgi:hypothetical protein